jgi:hypothetical protein
VGLRNQTDVQLWREGEILLRLEIGFAALAMACFPVMMAASDDHLFLGAAGVSIASFVAAAHAARGARLVLLERARRVVQVRAPSDGGGDVGPPQ